MIHCIGDSHVIFFSGNDFIPQASTYRDKTAIFRTHWLGAHTAYNIMKHSSEVEKILRDKVLPNDSVMFCFGEVDCRMHLIQQSQAQCRPLEEVVGECVQRYSQIFELVKGYGIQTIVWNVPPSTIFDVDGEYPTYGNCKERNETTILFNSILKQYCEENKVIFISVFDKLIDENGLTRQQFYADTIHLSQAVMPFVLEELRRKGVLNGAGSGSLTVGKTEENPSIIQLSPVEHYRTAQQLIKENKIYEALDEIRLAITGGITSVDAHYTHAQLLIAIKQYDEAVPILERVVSLMPWHSYAFNDLAVIYFQKSDYDRAIEYYKTALSADCSNYNTLRNLLNLLKGLGRLDEATGIARTLAANDPYDEQLRAILREYKLSIDDGWGPEYYSYSQSPPEEKTLPVTDEDSSENSMSETPVVKGLFTLREIKLPNNSLEPFFLKELKRIFDIDTFIESGTFSGDTSLTASKIFKTVHTIELSYELYQQAVLRLGNIENIYVYQGDSGRVLPQILNGIKGKMLFWLDGHYSAGATAKSEKDTPIIEELKAIKSAGIKDAVILVDDIRLFLHPHMKKDPAAEDYPSIGEVCALIHEIDESYCFVVISDVLMAYRETDKFNVSPVISACTASRLFDGKNFDTEKVIGIEREICHAASEELATIESLYRSFISQSATSAYCRLWYALTLIGQNNYKEAVNELQGLIGCGFNHWRAELYLAEACLNSGNHELAEKTLSKIVEIAGDSDSIQRLKTRMPYRAEGELGDKNSQDENRAFKQFLQDLEEFRSLSLKSERLFKIELSPKLEDNSKTTQYDAQYVLHTAWAARILAKTRPQKHIDIGSSVYFSTIASAFIPMAFYDYRPAELNLPNLESKFADLTSLHFKDNSVQSLSCMHVIEHIGLGRYGDPIDPDGDIKAISEVKRVLKQDGNLLFVAPIGKPRILFNAHRVYSYKQIMDYFEGFFLKDFSLIPDVNHEGLSKIIQGTEEIANQQNYGCGCFWFKKK